MRHVNKKITIIEDLLQNNEDSYKNSNSLQQIADLLELGNILPFVIDYSLSQENYEFAIMKVKEMMEEKEEISFGLCEKLIQNDQISLNQKLEIVKQLLFIFLGIIWIEVLSSFNDYKIHQNFKRIGIKKRNQTNRNKEKQFQISCESILFEYRFGE
jgi:hypothetical protein